MGNYQNKHKKSIKHNNSSKFWKDYYIEFISKLEFTQTTRLSTRDKLMWISKETQRTQEFWSCYNKYHYSVVC